MKMLATHFKSCKNDDCVKRCIFYSRTTLPMTDYYYYYTLLNAPTTWLFSI